jgi:Zn-dependent peptidase ImmA (M78 family)
MDKEKVIESANSMYESPGEIDIVELCSLLGIDVYGDDESAINAKISVSDKKNFEITFNSKHPLTRIRFSIAHELAHFFLHKDEIIKNKTLYRKEDASDQEKEADKLAEEILMPERSVLDFMKKFNSENINEEVVKFVANRFQVSIIVAAIRLRNLNFNTPYISYSNV